MKKVLLLISLISIFVISGCDLSHKHYYNDYGKCNCGKDIALTFTYSNGEYISEVHGVIKGEVYYYKFDGHGENGCEFFLDNKEMLFDRVEVRSDGILASVATSEAFGTPDRRYNSTLMNGRTYYLKVTYKTSGDIKVIIRGDKI